ncbi:FliI/YscN family ATPase [Endozoicomonas ascidiicola]|uniref:FliI/YscN family ATPase n=1 Tax=Endozoicomonas ascidiicola TaxID=1698521 RepID=UPI000AA06FFC|nr:FliI/YscN family ATPase [Endozoicomonas ascidiicola]
MINELPEVSATTANSMIGRLRKVPVASLTGRVAAVKGMLLEAVGVRLPVGQLCHIRSRSGDGFEAEVVGFNDKTSLLMSLSNHQDGISPGDLIVPVPVNQGVSVDSSLVGRVVDAMGEPLDNKPLTLNERIPVLPIPLNPMNRGVVDKPLHVGIRAIDGLFTLGRGQRIGLLAGSGIGKSTLLGMMTRNTQADVTVVGLIGERSREVKEFVEHTLGSEGMKKTVVVAAPGDESPVRRIRAASYCHRIAEYFRDQGKSVLLLMDSLTRYAQAHREIALTMGEPAASRGYPPSVFSKVPNLIERSGPGAGNGSITAVYTVLADGDDLQDPIVDCARSVLDGHIVLNRELAEKGHFPAIDLEKSLSRVMPQVTFEKHGVSAQNFRRLFSRYNHFQELMAIGAYQAGADQELDKAIEMRPAMERFLQQSRFEQFDPDASIRVLETMQLTREGAASGR